MRKELRIGLLVVLALVFVCATASAQKGAGDAVGLARQAVQVEIEHVSGTLDHIKTGPCKNTSGRAYIGTHLFLIQENGERINLHLGPENAVKEFVATLTIGEKVDAYAFRTEKVKDGDMIAKSVSTEKSSITIRDEDLRPVWAGDITTRPRGTFRPGPRRNNPYR